MKKFLLIAFTALILVSCGRNPEDPFHFGGGLGLGTSFDFTATFPAEARSPLLGNSWAADDRIFLFIKDVTTGYLLMQYQEETSSWSVTPRGSIEMRDMLYNGRKLIGAVFLRQAADVTASFADGKWSFSPVRNLPFFTMGEVPYEFDQDGSGNYSFSGRIDNLSAGESWTYTYCTTVYVEEPDDGAYFRLSDETLQPVPGLAGIGSDGTLFYSKGEKGDDLDGITYEKDKKKYRVYLGIHHDAVKVYVDGKENGFGHLFLMNYGDHSLACFQLMDRDIISNPAFMLPKRPSADASSGNGWWPFIGYGTHHSKAAGVPINGVDWAVQNEGADYPWESGNRYSFKGVLDAQVSGWRLPSTEKKEFLSLTEGTHLYWTRIHNLPGYIVVDADVKTNPFIFLPGGLTTTVEYWGDTHTWTEGEGEEAVEKMSLQYLSFDNERFRTQVLETEEARDARTEVFARFVKN